MNKIILSSVLGLSILLTSVIPTKAYTIEPGDTLSGISQSQKVSIEKIVELNPFIKNINLIYIGMWLNLGLIENEEEQIEDDNNNEESSQQDYYEMTVESTAYTAYCAGCSGTTAIGIDLRANPNQLVIAVDPRVIPLGSKVWVEGYGEAIAGDTGGAIKGNKIDVFIPNKTDAYTWGRKQVEIKVYN